MLPVHVVYPLHGVVRLRRGLQLVGGVNALDHDDAVLVFDLAVDLAGELAAGCVDLARFQRASEGAEESAAGGGDDVVERCGVRLRYVG